MAPLKRILIAAAGTGGHVFPALTVAKQLIDDGHEVVWLGTQQGMESAWVLNAKIPLMTIAMTGVRGRHFRKMATLPFTLTRAIVQAMRIIRRTSPDLVLAMGGFVTVPAGISARLLSKQLILHEQNAIPGMANRLLRPWAAQVATAFPTAFAERPRVRYIGNPLRTEMIHLPPPQQRFAGRQGPLRLLILGGSRGALALNTLVPQGLAQLPFPVSIRHQSGATHVYLTTMAYQQVGVSATVTPFIDDMAEAYGWADVVICRAGAMTLAELTAVGVPAILIPYPYAVDDHQRVNAAFLVEHGAAQLLTQSTLTVDTLRQAICHMTSLEKRLAMADAARALRQIDATQQLIDLITTTHE